MAVRTAYSPSPPSAPRGGASASPLRSMLALSAATRAVADEALLRPAALVLQREACQLTGAVEATLIVLDRAAGALWTRDGSAISDEVAALVTHVAGSGQRVVYGPALFEPIGPPPACGVLALRRRAHDRFEPDDVALVAALAGGVAAPLQRLIDAQRQIAVSARP